MFSMIRYIIPGFRLLQVMYFLQIGLYLYHALTGLGSFHFESAWTLLPYGIVSEPSPRGAWLLIGISSEPFQQLKSSSLPVSR